MESGKWYILPNSLRPNDRTLDYRVKITGMDRRFVYFETEPRPGWSTGTPLRLPRKSFLKMAMPIHYRPPSTPEAPV